MDHAQAVRDFTLAAGHDVPNTPAPMTRAEVEFLVKMVLDEMLELMETTHATSHEALDVVTAMLCASKPWDATSSGRLGDKVTAGSAPDDAVDALSPLAVAAEQADALVDAWYYSLDAAAKRGMNLGRVFELVHAANMAKRDPETRKFVKREDGKVVKPAGWAPPDVATEMERQAREGSFVPRVTDA